MLYIVEKTDPHAIHPHLTDEHFELGLIDDAVSRWEDLTGESAEGSREAISSLLVSNQVEWVDPETGVEVTARIT